MFQDTLLEQAYRADIAIAMVLRKGLATFAWRHGQVSTLSASDLPGGCKVGVVKAVWSASYQSSTRPTHCQS